MRNSWSGRRRAAPRRRRATPPSPSSGGSCGARAGHLPPAVAAHRGADRSCRRPGPLSFTTTVAPRIVGRPGREAWAVTPADPAVGPDELYDRLHLDLLRRAHRRGVGRVAVVDDAGYSMDRFGSRGTRSCRRPPWSWWPRRPSRPRASEPGAEGTGLDTTGTPPRTWPLGASTPCRVVAPRRSPDPRWSGRVSRGWSPPPRPRAGAAGAGPSRGGRRGDREAERLLRAHVAGLVDRQCAQREAVATRTVTGPALVLAVAAAGSVPLVVNRTVARAWFAVRTTSCGAVKARTRATR